MSPLLVGCARCSTDQQDLTAQRDALLGLGVEADRIYGRPRPDRDQSRTPRAIPAGRPSGRRLAHRPAQISLSLGGSVYDPIDAVGRLLFNVLAMVADFESDLIRLRSCEGMTVARAKGRLKGKQPKFNRRPGSAPRR